MKKWLLKNHVLRPLMVVVFLMIVLAVFRELYVPNDFAIQEGFTYNLYRQSNIGEWQSITVKYQGNEYCGGCHGGNLDLITASPHSPIQCENCHGPGVGHPETVPKLAIGDSQKLCLRCHAELPYAESGRSKIRGIDPTAHGLPGRICVDCHNPHQPTTLPMNGDGEEALDES